MTAHRRSVDVGSQCGASEEIEGQNRPKRKAGNDIAVRFRRSGIQPPDGHLDLPDDDDGRPHLPVNASNISCLVPSNDSAIAPSACETRSSVIKQANR